MHTHQRKAKNPTRRRSSQITVISHLTSHLFVLSCDVLNVYIPTTADRYGSGLTGVSQPSLPLAFESLGNACCVMPKLKDLKRRSHLAGISSEGHATRGVGLSSRQSEDFAIPTDWTTEERRVGSEVRIRYRSPAGRYFASRTAIQEFLAYPSDADAPYGSSMDEYEQCGTGAYPFSTNFALRSVRASSNIKLATAIPFARAAITIWTIN